MASPTFFTDRDLGRRVPDALAAAGYTVEKHDDHFDPLTPDPVWLTEIGLRGWVPFSHNKDIRYRTQERDAAMRAGIPLFLLIGHARHAELATNLVCTLPRIIEFLDTHAEPFIAKVYRPTPVTDVGRRPGRVAMWLSGSEWRSGSPFPR